jgi:hypothetical protein
MTGLEKSPDGSMTAAQVEAALRSGQDDVYRCEAKRSLLVGAWPVITTAKAQTAPAQ